MIFLLGSQAIYYGMIFNGSAHPRNFVWRFISGVHDLVVYGLIVSLGGGFIFFVFSLRPDPPPIKQVAKEPTAEEIETRKKWAQEAAERKAQHERLIEAERILEEQRKQEAIKKRRERSAAAAAHDALDDFL